MTFYDQLRSQLGTRRLNGMQGRTMAQATETWERVRAARVKRRKTAKASRKANR